MPSQRPSRLARAPPNGAHENRQSMYPGVQARGSDAEDSDLTRRPYHTYSELIGSDHGDEERNSPMAPPRGDTFTDSGYGSGIGRSHPSQSSLSNSTLFPEGSDRSSGTNPSHNASVPHDRYPFGRTDRDRLYEQDPNMVWSRLSGWHSRTTGPYVRIKAKNIGEVI